MSGQLDKQITQFVQSLKCHAEGPYPSTKVSRKNSKDAELILDAYAGKAGELTAILQYFDHSVRFGKDPFAETELCIAMVEMLHLDLLGDLISALGGDLKYWDSEKTMWTGNDVYYSDGKVDLVEMDLKIEREAIKEYDKLIRVVEEPEAVALFQRIKADEEVHVKLFEEELKKMRQS